MKIGDFAATIKPDFATANLGETRTERLRASEVIIGRFNNASSAQKA